MTVKPILPISENPLPPIPDDNNRGSMITVVQVINEESNDIKLQAAHAPLLTRVSSHNDMHEQPLVQNTYLIHISRNQVVFIVHYKENYLYPAV